MLSRRGCKTVWTILRNNVLSKLFLFQSQVCTEGYSEPCRSSKMELFARIVNGFQPLTFFAKNSILPN